MSITVDYFFDSTCDLATVADQVNIAIGCQLIPYQGDPSDFFSRFLGMDLSLMQHSYENDRELDFENYRFCLSLRTAGGTAQLRHIQIPAMVSIVHALFVGHNITGMLVFDVQVLLARYQERIDPKFGGPSLYDALSDGFVNLPGHFNELIRRVPEGWLDQISPTMKSNNT